MEYTQWVKKSVDEWAIKNVLILVVMEYTQWGGTISWSWKMQGLNPCCNGIYSMSTTFDHDTIINHMS